MNYSTLIFMLFVLRMILDLLFPGEKGSVALIGYTTLLCGIILFFLFETKITKKAKILLYLLLISTVPSLFFATKFGVFEQLKFNAQVLLPLIFLIVVRTSSVNFEILRGLVSRYLIPSLLFFMVIYFIENSGSDGIIETFTNNPDHVVAQTILKLNLTHLVSGITSYNLMVIGALLIINVRSVILAYITPYIFCLSDRLAATKKTLVFIAIIIFFIFIYTQFPEFISRLLYKGRSVEGDDLYNITSGRTHIWDFYLNYISHNFTLTNYLFGAGSVWFSSAIRLSAHNDFLNLFISYGLFGSFVILYSWFYILGSVENNKIKIAGIFSFSILLLTNGVVFHQSNIYFCLLFSSCRSEMNYR